jgi:hypothetical protein
MAQIWFRKATSKFDDDLVRTLTHNKTNAKHVVQQSCLHALPRIGDCGHSARVWILANARRRSLREIYAIAVWSFPKRVLTVFRQFRFSQAFVFGAQVRN